MSLLRYCSGPVTPHVFTSTGAGEEVPADRGIPQHEGDPDQEERADQGAEETAAEVVLTFGVSTVTGSLMEKCYLPFRFEPNE